MKKRVFMLGWEFPPLINGGLGIACSGLAKALSDKVQLSFLIPQAAPEKILDNTELIGVNQLSVEDLVTMRSSLEVHGYRDATCIPADLFPYHDHSIREGKSCLLYTSPSPRDLSTSRMPSSA